MSDYQDLRDELTPDDKPLDDWSGKNRDEIDTGKIFGLAAGERMMLSIILFLTVTVLSIALLLATNSVALP
ncbi:MAG: hypothetical protein KF716_21215 [Anaerolineae bacterium]|nr:hypothetical protein [Anaerolineae bacterium]